MSGASRLLMLLSTSFPFLHPRPSFLRLARRSLSTHDHHPIYHSTPLPLHLKKSKTQTQNHRPSIFKSQLHNNSAATFESKGSSGSLAVEGNLLWPEWAKFVETLSDGGYFSRGLVGGDEDEILEIEGMPDEFERAAMACLAFARDRPDALRLLAKKNIEVIVNSGSPSLFKNGTSSARRMRSFLRGDESNVLEFERAQTLDVMRYVLSYAYDSLNISEGIKQSDTELVEASVRNVLAEFVNMNGTVRISNVTESTPREPPVNYEQFSRPPVQNIEMKRGDWICPKCSFMNFARNKKCLECEEARPMRQLTGREWECPQCDFYNYGRNTSCLRCDCKRPVDTPSGTLHGNNSSINQILSGSKTKTDKSSESSINESLDRILGGTSSTRQSTSKTDPGYVPFVPLPPDMFSKPQNTNNEVQQVEDAWSKKVAELDNVTEVANTIPDQDFPDIMPMRKGENRFVVSKKKDRSLTSPPYKRRLAMEQANESDFVPFVPFPPGYFAKKDSSASPENVQADRENHSTQFQGNNSNESKESWNPEISETNLEREKSQSSNQSWNSEFSRGSSNLEGEKSKSSSQNWSKGFSGKSLEGSAVAAEPDPLDMSEEAKAARWFRRAAQIKNISELSEIPDEDFPEIMPMRKGVNRFVVSKRKTPLERRLTSPQYRRNLPIVSSEPEKDSS